MGIIECNGKYGFRDKNGKESKIEYDFCWNFYEGFACVQKNEKWGYINSKFEEATQEEILNSLCIKKDKKGYYFKKILNKNLTSPVKNFQYKLKKMYKFNLNENVENDCEEGFNVATEKFIKEFYKPEKHDIFLALLPVDAKIIIPFNLKKIRSNKGSILKKII